MCRCECKCKCMWWALNVHGGQPAILLCILGTTGRSVRTVNNPTQKLNPPSTKHGLTARVHLKLPLGTARLRDANVLLHPHLGHDHTRWVPAHVTQMSSSIPISVTTIV